MEKTIAIKIEQFLKIENPSDEQIKEAATLLLRCNPAKERCIYNTAMRRPKGTLSWVRTDLKKYLDIHKRGLERSQVADFNNKVLVKVRETLAVIPDDVEKEKKPSVPILGVRGKRADHDELPDDIKDIWSRNGERWKKMRQLHAQLAVLIAQPDYSPCDGNEICFQLRTADTALRNDYHRYDTYKASAAGEEEEKDTMEVFTDNVKTIQNARTIISRGLSRKSAHTDESLTKVQDAVNTLYALKQVIKPETIEKLKAIGVVIPNTPADA